MTPKIRFLFFLILILSSFLRLGLATVNREANDPHLKVTRIIMREGRLPEADECAECCHPKLFHYVIAIALKMAGVSAKKIEMQVVFTQLLNALLGAATIVIVWAFINSIPIDSESLKVVAFALAAFNPKLIGINAQATNDTFGIFFSVAAIYFAFLFLKQGGIAQLLACIVFAALGLATKTNTMPAVLAILLALIVKVYVNRRRSDLLYAALFLTSVVALSFLNPLTQYWINYQKYGQIIMINRGETPHPLPDFFQKTYFERPGIVSIQDGLFTFKFLNLLEFPRLSDEQEPTPPHRTSLWTQLYARAHTVHFDNWPPSWSTKGGEYFPLTRAIYVFALIPTALMPIGAGVSLIKLIPGFFKRNLNPIHADYGVMDIALWGYVAFIVLFASIYRDFSFMKVIFIYPAILSFVAMFVRAGNTLQTALKNAKWASTALSFISAALVALYIADVVVLIVHLQSLL